MIPFSEKHALGPDRGIMLKQNDNNGSDLMLLGQTLARKAKHHEQSAVKGLTRRFIDMTDHGAGPIAP